MSIIYQNESRTPIYPNTSLTKVYYQTTVVWESSHYQPDEVLFESSTAGTYSLDILDTANYEVYCIGGGAGALVGGQLSSFYSIALSGGSGGGFIGIFNLNDGNYQIIIGSRGTKKNASGGRKNYGEAGGYSQITNIIKCNGGTQNYLKLTTQGGDDGHSVSSGGSVELSLTPISYTLNTKGNNGSLYNFVTSGSGGASVYNSYGKGGDIEANNSTNGYVKIIYKGT